MLPNTNICLFQPHLQTLPTAGRTSPAVDHYGGVVVPVGPHGFDKLDECAARLWDAVLGPRGVVEVTNQNVVAVLRKSSLHKRESKLSTVTGSLTTAARTAWTVTGVAVENQQIEKAL